MPRPLKTDGRHAMAQALLGWLVSVQGPNDLQARLYAAGAPEDKTFRSVIDEMTCAMALVGDHMSVTNQRVNFERHLTAGEIGRFQLKAGEVKPFR